MCHDDTISALGVPAAPLEEDEDESKACILILGPEF